MSDIDYLQEQMQKLDADRMRLKLEIEKSKHDLRMFAGNVDEETIEKEKWKIRHLQDILEDVEISLDNCTAELFDIAKGEPISPDGLDDMLDPGELDNGTEYEQLVKLRDKTQSDLEKYKEQRSKTQAELLVLDDVIEATEKELDQILSELIQYEQ